MKPTQDRARREAIAGIRRMARAAGKISKRKMSEPLTLKEAGEAIRELANYVSVLASYAEDALKAEPRGKIQ